MYQLPLWREHTTPKGKTSRLAMTGEGEGWSEVYMANTICHELERTSLHRNIVTSLMVNSRRHWSRCTCPKHAVWGESGLPEMCTKVSLAASVRGSIWARGNREFVSSWARLVSSFSTACCGLVGQRCVHLNSTSFSDVCHILESLVNKKTQDGHFENNYR